MKYSYLHVINSLDTKYGGPPIAITNLAISQKANGHKVSIVSTYISEKELNTVKNEFSYLKEKGIEIIQFKAKTFYRISFKLIMFFLKNKRNNIYYFHGLYRFPTTFGPWICRLKNFNYVIRIHGSLDPYLFNKATKGKGFLVLKKLSEFFFDIPNIQKAVWIHLTSKNELKKLPKSFSKSSTKLVIPNGISEPNYTKFINIREKYNIKINQKILLYLGRINNKKGIDILLNSFSLVHKQVKNITLLIVGPDNDNYKKELNKIFSKLNEKVKSQVIFDSQIPRKYIKSYYSQSDLTIFPSRTENFGMTVIESIYYGTPALISKNIDIFDDLDSYKVVGLIKYLKSKNVYKDIIKTMNNKKLSAEVKSNGKEIIKNLYSWNSISEMIEKYSDKLIKFENVS